MPTRTPHISDPVLHWVIDHLHGCNCADRGWFYYPELLWAAVDQGIRPGNLDRAVRVLFDRKWLTGNSAVSTKIYLTPEGNQALAAMEGLPARSDDVNSIPRV